ncbi:MULTISPECIES: iron ABC transporter permease [unclassified Microbacterium]|uniref:iron ABC transporter permease n=2 Tax=Microbacterium TaxID=33882 RepID=UPI002469B029|nr:MULTISPECIES: iron ABC transporter permease [unclassified Microbacterium]MDH5131773.1 iron ABC transporter permease [Microbacterium sp. RD10]MDH5135578.1 iron ABC transporter permease [Microbacterium sp. RD11]MDH5153707.1 iron ABC transporter permease [Microbacterium sp. RD06]MDH5165969.1 iron ABC transporter permease [Microbacterium sp. RD02]
MTETLRLDDATATAEPDAPASAVRVGAEGRKPAVWTGVGVLVALAVVLVAVACWHLTQGTSGAVFADADVLWGSRVPRLAAGVAVGVALGVAGILLQSLARNALASPDTLGVTAGAYLAVTALAAFGIAVPVWASGAVAFAGGIVAAGIVLGLAGGAGSSTTRLILAGSALALAFQAATSTLLILFDEETKGLLAWGSGSLSQLGLTAFLQAAPVVVVVTVLALVLARRLDILSLGDDTASSLGVPIRSTRTIGILLAVTLTAVAVTLAGPMGFVGLCAPVLARLLTRVVPSLNRHLLLIPASGLLGALVVILSDALLRALIGAEAAILIPTGVATTLLGAIVLVLMARRLRDAGPTREPPRVRFGVRSRLRFRITLALVALGVAGVLLLGLLAGHTWLLTGDIALWLQGQAPAPIAFALDERAPRIVAAVVAGAALALSGAVIQGVSRNPLADPGILGVTGGGGLGAVLVITSITSSTGGMIAGAVTGSLLAFALVYLLSWRGGLNADRFLLIGIGVSYFTVSLTTFFLLRSNPWDTPKIYTWLSGTTYGRVWEQVIPLAIVLVIAVPFVVMSRRELDVLSLDEDTPRLVGIRLEPVRLTLLLVAAVLAALSVTAIGVIGFVGLVAPHAARALVGARHSRVIPTAVLLGGLLVGIADTIGRTVIAPAQLPAGLVVALIGAPYFVWLLWRSR